MELFKSRYNVASTLVVSNARVRGCLTAAPSDF